MTNRESKDYLQDILDAAEKAERFVGDLNFDAFKNNDEKVFAVVRALEIIGESAKHVPEEVRNNYPDIPSYLAQNYRPYIH